jgi:23S rRNA (guanosine2251-2'-O)-methyltransferase
MAYKKSDPARHPRRARESRAPVPLDQAVLYGLHAVREALLNEDRQLLALHATANAAREIAPLAEARGLALEIETSSALARRAPEGAVHQGAVLLAASLPPADLDSFPLTGPVLVLDQVTDPHNVGAIIRTGAAFAASALVTTRRFSPEATGVLAKAASGGLEHLPWARETNLGRALDALGERGVLRIGLDGDAPEDLRDIAPDGPFALVLGAEGKGLRQGTAGRCDRLARIALPGALQTLNVSNAAAVALTILCR